MNTRDLPPPTRIIWLRQPREKDFPRSGLARSLGREGGWKVRDAVPVGKLDVFLLLEKEEA